MTDEDDSKYPSELADRFQVRMPAGMRDRIKAEAEANNRSMNAEIVSALEFWLEWMERPIQPPPPEASATLPVDGIFSNEIYEIVREAVREALAMYGKSASSPTHD